MRVATATSSQLAAKAALEVAEHGGNAVDCALAAALLTMNTEPGVCALAGSAFVTIWPADGAPVTIDGNVAIPGLGSAPPTAPIESVSMEYGGGVQTIVGAPSVAVPGSLAALELASARYGVSHWAHLIEPSIRAARQGFPLSTACHYYLQYSGLSIFGRSDDGFRALHDTDGALRPPGSRIVVPHLADSLETIAREGGDALYHGTLAQSLAAHVQAGGGRLTLRDLDAYRPIVREPLTIDMNDWRIAVNPPPAVGGAVLAAMLLAFVRKPARHWGRPEIAWLVEVQRAILEHRHEHLDLAEDLKLSVDALLESVAAGHLPAVHVSASTVHTSAVDDAGNACAITASSGYGSGEMPAGTGLWLNNCLGETELNRHGLAAGPPGRRLLSNMTPGVARSADRVVAFGSPGADRITTALHQFLINFVQQDMSLSEAIATPRVHVDLAGGCPRLAVEPGIELPPLAIEVSQYPTLNMYFGGVGAALYSAGDGFAVAADPRREGATCVSAG